jgi:hypothetical protein
MLRWDFMLAFQGDFAGVSYMTHADHETSSPGVEYA